MKLTFLGATHTVTGSKYLLEVADKKVLIDCGLFQGYKELRLRNWAKPPFDPAEIDAILITHAHIDHTGYIPLIVRNGFKGPIYSTKATHELCSILLPDSGYIHEEDARRANLYGYSKHHPALPLYTQQDAVDSLKQFVPLDFNTPYQITDELTAQWHRAGHIFGAACVRCQAELTDVLFTGDVGRPHDPIMKPPEPLNSTDILICEATYGDRLHETDDPTEMIGEIVNKTVKRGGSILIPSFAVGRAQNILYYLYQLLQRNEIPQIPIYLDSPMAIDATKIMLQFSGEHKLSKELCINVCKIATYTNTVEQSKAIYQSSVPKLIISASGMATGGRVLHHLKALAPDHRNTILFTGYQAGLTRGDRIIKGEKKVKIHGSDVPINAEVAVLTNTSAHADYQELTQWLATMPTPPRQVYLTHGEDQSLVALKQHIEEQLNWPVIIPDFLDSIYQ